MEPQNTQNTLIDNDVDGANLLSRQISGCALTVLHTPGLAKGIDHIHQAQCLNYLKATGLPLCLLLNFGSPRLEIKRFVLSQ